MGTSSITSSTTSPITSSITSPIALSSSYPDPVLAGQSTPSAPTRQPLQINHPAAASPQDTVHLSELAQIQQMSQQGDSVAAIASTTGLTPSEIDSDLGIFEYCLRSLYCFHLHLGRPGRRTSRISSPCIRKRLSRVNPLSPRIAAPRIAPAKPTSHYRTAPMNAFGCTRVIQRLGLISVQLLLAIRAKPKKPSVFWDVS
jgi:hypothetical protein